MSPTTSALIVAFAAIVALAFIAAGLLERVHALEQAVGTAPSPAGRPSARRLDDPHFRPDGRPLVAVIASPTCAGCDRLVPDLDRLLDRDLDVRVLWEDDVGGPAPPGVETAVITRQDALAAGATATPFALVVDERGVVRWSGAVADITRLTAVTESSLADHEESSPS